MKPLSDRVESTEMVTLVHHPRNPRHGDIGAISESIKANGFYGAVVVQRSTRHILIGNHRVKAARALGMDKVPVLFVDCDDDRALRILLSENRTNDLASYDDSALAALLQDLRPTAEGLTGTGFDLDALDDLLAEIGKPLHLNLDEAPPVPAVPKSRTGDLYEMGEHRLLCGDSADSAQVGRLMDGKHAALVLADPPYNVNYRGGSSGEKRERDDAYPDERADYGGWLTKVLAAGWQWSDARAALHIWHSSSEMRNVLSAIDGAKWKDRSLIIWDKGSIQGGIGQTSKQYRTRFEPMLYCHKKNQTPRWFGPGNESDLWPITGPRNNPLHPTMKPVELYERSIQNHSERGDIVLELFGGSGTTLVAAESTSRHAYLMEINPPYCDVIVARWEKLTGKTAKKVATGSA